MKIAILTDQQWRRYALRLAVVIEWMNINSCAAFYRTAFQSLAWMDECAKVPKLMHNADEWSVYVAGCYWVEWGWVFRVPVSLWCVWCLRLYFEWRRSTTAQNLCTIRIHFVPELSVSTERFRWDKCVHEDLLILRVVSPTSDFFSRYRFLYE